MSHPRRADFYSNCISSGQFHVFYIYSFGSLLFLNYINGVIFNCSLVELGLELPAITVSLPLTILRVQECRNVSGETGF
jgi:hypothetical protein